MERVVHGPVRVAHQYEPADPVGEGREERVALDPGEVHPDAEMNAPPEGDMAKTVAPDVERVGVVEAPFVAIGGALHHQHLRSGTERDAGELDILCDVPAEKVDGGVEPEDFELA